MHTCVTLHDIVGRGIHTYLTLQEIVHLYHRTGNTHILNITGYSKDFHMTGYTHILNITGYNTTVL